MVAFTVTTRYLYCHISVGMGVFGLSLFLTEDFRCADGIPGSTLHLDFSCLCYFLSRISDVLMIDNSTKVILDGFETKYVTG